MQWEDGTGRFFNFPWKHKYDEELRQKWVIAISRRNPNGTLWQPHKYSKVCRKHFPDGVRSNIWNHPNSVPSIFPEESVALRRTAIKKEYPERIVAAPRLNSDADSTVPCGTIITGNDVIQYDTLKPEEMKEAVQDPVRRDLNLLSMGKKLLDYSKVGIATEVRRLMKDGAPFIADWVGTSPLHYSVMNKHVEVTELLLKHGICKDTRNKVGRTPLHIAAHMGLAYMVKLLLTYGANVNCKDMLRMTPLHWAAECGDLLTAKILIDYGADITTTNKFGKTACAVARSNKHMEIVRLILDTELLPLATRALKVSDMRSKIVSCTRDMKPVAEILAPVASEMKPAPIPELKTKKKKLVVIATNDGDGPIGTIRFGGVIDAVPERSRSPDEMSADSAIKLLQSHGVAIMEPDKETVVSTAVLSGHTIRLTDAGKLAFKSLEKNVRFEKLPHSTQGSDDEIGPTPAKRKKVTIASPPKRESSRDEDGKSSGIIIGSALSPCTIDLPSLNSTSEPLADIATTLNSISNPLDRTKVFLQRLKDKQKEILRHLEILENQRTIKQNELAQVSKQIKTLEEVTNFKK